MRFGSIVVIIGSGNKMSDKFCFKEGMHFAWKRLKDI